MKTILAYVVLTLLPICAAAQETKEEGKLRDFGKEVERGTSESSESQKEESEEEDDAPSTGEIIGDILFSIFRDVVVPAATESAIEAAPDTSTVDEPEVFHSFAQYPYHEEGHGLYKIGGDKDFSLNLRGNLHYEGQGFLGGGARLRISPIRYVSGEAQINLLTERVNLRTERMMLLSFFLNYNLVRENYCAMWVGLGEKLLRGAGATADGVAANVGLEIYPVQPMSLHASLSVGPYDELLLIANFHSNRFSFFFGYQGFYSGSQRLGGMVAGTSLYL